MLLQLLLDRQGSGKRSGKIPGFAPGWVGVEGEHWGLTKEEEVTPHPFLFQKEKKGRKIKST